MTLMTCEEEEMLAKVRVMDATLHRIEATLNELLGPTAQQHHTRIAHHERDIRDGRDHRDERDTRDNRDNTLRHILEDNRTREEKRIAEQQDKMLAERHRIHQAQEQRKADRERDARDQRDHR